jgi:hypothetical protein
MADQSTMQMALTRDLGPGGFMERVTAVMAATANSVLSESAGTAYHSGRAQYAQRVMANPSQAAQQGGPLLVMGQAIVDQTTYDESTKTSVCAATDAEVQAQVMLVWNGLAGLDTPSA